MKNFRKYFFTFPIHYFLHIYYNGNTAYKNALVQCFSTIFSILRPAISLNRAKGAKSREKFYFARKRNIEYDKLRELKIKTLSMMSLNDWKLYCVTYYWYFDFDFQNSFPSLEIFIYFFLFSFNQIICYPKSRVNSGFVSWNYLAIN